MYRFNRQLFNSFIAPAAIMGALALIICYGLYALYRDFLSGTGAWLVLPAGVVVYGIQRWVRG